MKNRNPFAKSRPAFAILAASVLMLALPPATASAQSSEKLTRYLPSASQMIVGFNVSKLSKSKYYKEGLAWLRSEAGEELKALDDAGLDLSEDLESIVVSIPDMNQQNENFTLAISGSFDNEKLLEAMQKETKFTESKKDKTKIYSHKELDLVFPSKGVLWMSSGEGKYRGAAFDTIGSKKKSVSANKLLTGLMSDIDTAQGFWMVGDTSSLKAKQAEGKPQPKSLGISLDINQGLALNVLANLPSEEDAKALVTQVETLKKDKSQTAMLAMFGAGSLVTNLETKQDGAKILASTSMSATELDTLIKQVKAMAQTYGRSNSSMPSQPVQSK